MNPNEVATFRGFFIQARLVADDSNVGGFLSGDGYRLSNCSPPTVSQMMLGLGKFAQRQFSHMRANCH